MKPSKPPRVAGYKHAIQQMAREDRGWKQSRISGRTKTLKVEAHERFRGETNPKGRRNGHATGSLEAYKNARSGLLAGVGRPATTSFSASCAWELETLKRVAVGGFLG